MEVMESDGDAGREGCCGTLRDNVDLDAEESSCDDEEVEVEREGRVQEGMASRSVVVDEDVEVDDEERDRQMVLRGERAE
ncbi:hypothetical protein HK101_003201 [Irineochytrium annulatum]|nr:hypothetical protein HK101_003201 [Irineochytrium annulatum]